MKQAEMKRRQAESIAAILSLVMLAVAARVSGENGVAYIGAAMEIFWLLWILVGGNVSDTLGRLLRVRNAKGQYKNVHKMRIRVFVLQAVLGALGTLALLFFADQLAADIFGVKYSAFILMVLAPALLLRSISSVLLGLFQGEGSELPTAVSVILRQLFVLGFGLMFGRMLGNYGEKVSLLLQQKNFSSMYVGVGIAIAVSLTECFIVIFLFLIYRGIKRPKEKLYDDGMKYTDSIFDSIRIFFVGRGLQPLMQLLTFLPLPLGLLFLGKATGSADETAVGYGAYLSGYLVVCGILCALLYIVILPMIGRIFIHQRKEEQRFAKVIFQSGVHITAVHGMFAVICLMTLSSQIAALVSPGQPVLVNGMLLGGASITLFLPLSLYFEKILSLHGKKVLVLGALAIAEVVYIVSTAIFINTGKMGGLALVYGGVLGTGVFCVLLGILSCRQLRCRFAGLQLLAVPAGAAGVSGLVIMLLAKLLTPHVGNLVTVIVTTVAGAALYWTILILLRNFKEQELESIPGRKIIYAIGQLLRVY